MMRNAFILLVMLTCSLFARDSSSLNRAELKLFNEIIAKKIFSNSFNHDIETLAKEFIDNVNEAIDLDDEYLNLINHLQDFLSKEKQNIGLKNTDKFLKMNKTDPDVIEIIPEKLQYRILKKGHGSEVTQMSRPLVNYKLIQLDGTIVYETKEPQPVSLDDAILGFAKGLIGMKEQEKRIIYIHPDYGFKKEDDPIANSLLKIEVELLKSDFVDLIDNSLISNNLGYVR